MPSYYYFGDGSFLISHKLMIVMGWWFGKCIEVSTAPGLKISALFFKPSVKIQEMFLKNWLGGGRILCPGGSSIPQNSSSLATENGY